MLPQHCVMELCYKRLKFVSGIVQMLVETSESLLSDMDTVRLSINSLGVRWGRCQSVISDGTDYYRLSDRVE